MRRPRWIAAVVPLLVFGALLTDLEGDAWVLTEMLDAEGNTQIV